MTDDKLIKKWLNNQLSGSEEEVFEAEHDYDFNSKIIESAKKFKASHVSQVDSFETFNTSYKAKNRPLKKLPVLQYIIRIVAILVISFGIYTAFFNKSLITTNTLVSEKTTIELPDGSLVSLNALSQLEFDRSTWKENRYVNLQGEAYFKVAKGRTFDVITSKGTVTVVGTEFNVKQRKDFFEVQCYEGIVKVVSDSIERQLLAGDTYRMLNESFSEINITNTQPDWMTNKSVFKTVTYGEVLAELERQYAIEISRKNINTDRLFTGGFTHTNLENALQSITQPMNLMFKMNASKNLIEIYEAAE